jgi:hydrogenase maturation protease
MKDHLIIGIGNPGRQDDGVGWAFIDALGDKFLDGTDVERRFQLQIEDAELVSRYRTVTFVDASADPELPDFRIGEVLPNAGGEILSHRMSAGTVAALARELYAGCPACRLLEIRGFSFGAARPMTAGAKRNLRAALSFFGSHGGAIKA